MYIKFIPISAYGRNKKYKKQNYTSPPINYTDLPLKQQHNVHSSLYLYQLIVETRYTRNKTIPPPTYKLYRSALEITTKHTFSLSSGLSASSNDNRDKIYLPSLINYIDLPLK